MGNYINPYQFIEPYLTSPVPAISAGIKQGAELAKLPSHIENQKAQTALYQAQLRDKQNAIDAYNQIMGGQSIGQPEGIDLQTALRYKQAGLDVSRWLPQTKVEPSTGQAFVTTPSTGKTQAQAVPGAIIPKKVQVLPAGGNNVGGFFTDATGNVEQVEFGDGTVSERPAFAPPKTPEQIKAEAVAKEEGKRSVTPAPQPTGTWTYIGTNEAGQVLQHNNRTGIVRVAPGVQEPIKPKPTAGKSSLKDLLDKRVKRPNVDVSKERQLADAAIAAGVSKDKVKAAFKQRTGQDY